MRVHRPHAHLTAPSGWLNDPNGLIHWRGEYHVFYQYNPFSCSWQTPYWGHAVSADLVNWQQLPIAMRPIPGGTDADGCFSGCIVDDGSENPLAVYTGVRGDVPTRIEATCIARATDGLRQLVQHDANPVIPGPPDEEATEGFRDPFVWFENDRWQQIVGSGRSDEGGIVYHYQSDDLASWDYVGVFHRGVGKPGDPFDTGVMWECPQLVRGPVSDVLIISILDQRDPSRRKVVGISGRRTDGNFEETGLQLVDHGSAFYAPAITVDQSGRTLMWGWITEAITEAAQERQGWSGALTLPREVWIDDAGQLRSRVAHEAHALKETVLLREELRLVSGEHRRLPAKQAHLWIELEADLSHADGVAVEILADPAGRETTTIVYDRLEGELTLDRRRSSLSDHPTKTIERAPVTLDDGQLDLTVIVDGSTIEIFLGDRMAMTSRSYPTLPESCEVVVEAFAGPVTGRVELWELPHAIH